MIIEVLLMYITRSMAPYTYVMVLSSFKLKFYIQTPIAMVLCRNSDVYNGDNYQFLLDWSYESKPICRLGLG